MGGEYPCPHCEKVMNTRYNVQRHVNKCHREKEKEKDAASMQFCEEANTMQEYANA